VFSIKFWLGLLRITHIKHHDMASHDIDLVAASAQTQNFQHAYPGRTKGGKFPKDDIQNLLNQRGCVELRYYFSMPDPSKPNEISVVLVGVDSSGNDLIGTSFKLKNSATPCPPWCGNSNLLNHLP